MHCFRYFKTGGCVGAELLGFLRGNRTWLRYVAAWSPGWAAEGESPLNLPSYRITSSLACPGCLSALPETVFSLGSELQALRSQRCCTWEPWGYGTGMLSRQGLCLELNGSVGQRSQELHLNSNHDQPRSSHSPAAQLST